MSDRLFRRRLLGGSYLMALREPDGGAGSGGDLRQLMETLKTAAQDAKKTADDVKAVAETASTEVKNLGKVTEETKQNADKALTTANDAAARLAEVEQVVARISRGGGNQVDRRSAGERFVQSDEWKTAGNGDGGAKYLQASPARSVSVEMPRQLITSLTTDADGSAGDAIAPDRQAGILEIAQRRFTIRGLLAPGRTSSNLIQYIQETGFTNAAATQQAEGDQKAESTIKLDLKSTPVATIAHFMRASKQILDDAPAVASLIDNRLRYGYNLEEERQLLKGDGTNGDLLGLLHFATAYSPSFTPASAQIIDQLRLAMLQSYIALWPATGIVLNPIDWVRVELIKDSQGRYIIGQPQGVAVKTLWGVPVVDTPAMDEDSFLTGAFTPAAQIFDRETLNVAVSTEDRDNFVKNLVTVRAEGRLGLAVYRPEALIKGDFGFIS